LRAYPPASMSVLSSSSVAMPLPSLPLILPPNEQRADVDRSHRCRRSRRTLPLPRRGAIVATIERWRIPSARRRRESSRRRRGSAPLHPSHSSSSVAAAADAVP
jgi:hypothetical protein